MTSLSPVSLFSWLLSLCYLCSCLFIKSKIWNFLRHIHTWFLPHHEWNYQATLRTLKFLISNLLLPLMNYYFWWFEEIFCYIFFKIRIISFDGIVPTLLLLFQISLTFKKILFSLIVLKEMSLSLGTKISLKYICIPRISCGDITFLQTGYLLAPEAKFKS